MRAVVIFTYSNYRGEVSERRVMPLSIHFSKNKWHDGEQWFLDAFDLEKNQERSFAMKDIRDWRPEEA